MSEETRDDLVKYRMRRAEETILELPILIENKLWNTAVNRLYYACYYAVTALLASRDINASTHSGGRQMFGLHFVKTENCKKRIG